MADVFLSYARGDERVARTVAKQLTEAGYSVWWDSELLPHNRFANVIEEEIGAAHAVLVIWSEIAAKSQWVRAEAELGRSQGKLIQIAIEQCSIPLPFNQYQIAELRRWRGDPVNPQWQKILASVAHFKAPSNDPAASPRTRGRTVGRTLKLGMAGVAITAVVGGGVAIFRNFEGPPRGARIAIQPFRTIGSAPGLSDFAAELSDSLQNVLTQDQLQTLSPAEVDALKGDDLAGRAKQLGVGLMFSGAVQGKGTDIEVSMRIDDPVQRASLWTAEMSGPAAQSDQLQARVGALTVAVLNCSEQGLAPGADLTDSALQGFLHACELSQTASHGDAGGSAAYAMLDAMRQAAKEAPGFAGSHSMLAKHLAYVAARGLARDSASLRSEAESEARRALEINSKDPDALVALGLLTPTLDFAQRESWYRKALASNPSWSHANGFLGNVMTNVGRLQDALELYQRAASVNPLAADWSVIVPLALVNVGETSEADRQMALFAQRWPNNPLIWYTQVASMTAQKRWGDALKLLDNAADLPSQSAQWVSDKRELFEVLQSGNAAGRDRLRETLIRSSNTDPASAIYRLAMLGFVDDAFAIGQHYSPQSSDSTDFLFRPEIAALRADPRFMALAARFGLVDYWQRTWHWPDFCSDPKLPYDCRRQAAMVAAQPRPR